MDAEQRLNELGIILPAAKSPGGGFVRTRQSGSMLYVAGHGPVGAGYHTQLGKLGREVSIEQGYEAARNCTLSCLASVQAAMGSLNAVKGVIKVLGYVASADDFYDQPRVINGASDLLVAIFGDAGRHARSAIGVFVLPGNIPVEIEMILEIEPMKELQ